jgi:hypothetical protein
VLFSPGDPAALGAAFGLADAEGKLFEEYGARARKSYEQRFDPADSLRQLTALYQFAIENPV